MAADDRQVHIVIVGGGFAGAYCARRLRRRLPLRRARITLVNRTNYFVFTPLLVEAGTGALEPRHAVTPLRQFLRDTDLHMADVMAIDMEARRVHTRAFDGSERTLTYDHLVLAMGGVPQVPDVPGLRDHAYGMKDLADAVALRDRAVGLLEIANVTEDAERRRALLTFVVVGANYTGVEVAGEFNSFLEEARRLYDRVQAEDIRIILVDHGKRILSSLDENLADYASERLRRRGVEILLENTVTRVTPETVTFAHGDARRACTVIWTAGVAANPLNHALAVPRDTRGYILCDPELRVQGQASVWGIGDCAVNRDPSGETYPPTAQHAIREGEQAADNIARVLAGRAAEPLAYRTRGMMAPLGMRQGVARIFGHTLAGLPAWILWRTFYLAKMPGFGRSMRVMMDWTLDWFFRRDYVQLGIHGRRHESGAP